MENINILLSSLIVFLVIYLVYNERKNSKLINKISLEYKSFLESIEKYVEIFNEQNVKELLVDNKLPNETKAVEIINSIKNDFKKKLLTKNSKLTEEQEMLIDFIVLSLSLLIKTPPSLRQKLIDQTTNNEAIRTILNSKLILIEKYYVPVSILEVAVSENSKN
ncbi:MAG: hypothetical protein IPH62_08755 [Ignavibacteriae bacterium]|nr:hypothetical protein [Ignavibacteriota bacterium]